jgi:hypothetical protein
MVHPKPYGKTKNIFKVVHDTPHKVAMHVFSSPRSISAIPLFLAFVAFYI